MAAPVVNIGRAPELTLSEVPRPANGAGPIPAAPSCPPEPHHITIPIGSAEAIAYAVADHLSTRAARAVSDVLTPGSRTMRAAFVLDALAKAERCPLCAPQLAAEGLTRG